MQGLVHIFRKNDITLCFIIKKSDLQRGGKRGIP